MNLCLEVFVDIAASYLGVLAGASVVIYWKLHSVGESLEQEK
jgi:hypothetical protein